MKRGTKEFYDLQKSFEKSVEGCHLGYIPSDFEKDKSSQTSFYANGTVNAAFRAFMAGYAAAKCEYDRQEGQK